MRILAGGRSVGPISLIYQAIGARKGTFPAARAVSPFDRPEEKANPGMRKASSIALQAKTTTPSIQVCQNSKPHTPTAPPTADAAYALHLSRDGRAPIAQSAARPTPRRSRADRAKIEPGLQIDVVRMARIAVFKASTLVTLFVYEKSRKLPAYFIESARSSTDRAPDFESGGCRFEPCRAHQ